MRVRQRAHSSDSICAVIDADTPKQPSLIDVSEDEDSVDDIQLEE